MTFKRFIHILKLHSPANIARVMFRRQTRCPIVSALLFLGAFFAPVKAALISGRVLDGLTGAPLEGAHIALEGGEVFASDGEGRFYVASLPPGEVVLDVSYVGYLPDRRRVAFNAVGDTAQVELRLYPQAVALSDVVYTATRTFKTLKSVPVATELITRRDFERRGALTAADALDAEIGYEVRSDFSGRGVMLQGADPDKVLILVDGNRVIGRVNGSIDLEQIALSNVKQIEVVKGAVSTLYGSEAIGGVINVITAAPEDGLNIRFDGSGGARLGRTRGSPPNPNLASGVTLGSRIGQLDWSGSLRYSHTGLIDLNPITPHTDGTDESDRLTGDLRLRYPLGNIVQLTLTGRGFDEEKTWVEDGGLITLPISFDDREVNRQSGLAAEVLCQPSPEERYSVKVYRSDNHHRWEKWTQPQWGTPFVRDFSEGNEDYSEASFQLTKPIAGKHLMTLGGDLYQWDIKSDASLGGLRSPFAGSLTAWNLFAQDEWRVGLGWTLLPGMRYENHEIYGGNWSPRLSAMLELRDDLRLRASVGQGYRAPSSKELYFVFNHASAGYIVYGNRDLRPERSTNVNFSLEHNYRNSSVARITFFANWMRNLIDFEPIGVSEDYYTGIFRYNNIYSSWVKGVEVERGFIPLRGVEARIAYSYTISRNDSTGSPLVGRPMHAGRFDLTRQAGDWTVKVWGRYTSRSMFQDIYETDAQQSDEWAPASQVWNLALTRRVGAGLSFFLKVENLLDRTDSRYGPRDGRVVTVGQSWTLRE
ncbi:MAG: TonB-dependent receptor [Calditrichaeota bacterium]|nr:TonB-dependent receptor [Calditrichota bacterium]